MMTRRLFRSHTDRWIAGVCGGVAAYLGVDATAVRLAFVLLAFWRGFGLLLYLLMIVLVPEESAPELVTEPGLIAPPPEEDDAHRRARMLGAVLVLGGVYLLLRNSQLFVSVFEDRGLGVLLIVGGLILLLVRSGRLKGL